MPRAPNQRRREDVPNRDHIARYCNPQRVIHDPRTQAITGVFPQAFELRFGETYLSTHWMESFGVNVDIQFRAVVAALRRKHPNVKPKGAFARLNAGLVVEAGAARGHPIRVRDRSSPKDPGYAGVVGIPLDNSDLELLALFASECCIEIRGTDDIDGRRGTGRLFFMSDP
jgi:hypothetical protein